MYPLNRARTTAAGLLLGLSAAGCATGERPLGYVGPATLEGVVQIEREIELSDYRVLESSRFVPPSTCINGRFADRGLRDRVRGDLQGRRVRVSGTLYDIFEFVNEDPIGAAVGGLDNACGNRFFIVIRSVRPATAP